MIPKTATAPVFRRCAQAGLRAALQTNRFASQAAAQKQVGIDAPKFESTRQAQAQSKGLTAPGAVENDPSRYPEQMSAAAAGIDKYPSFTKALFMGQLHSPALYPYPAPDVLNEDQKDTIRQLLDPVWDFFANTNNAAANDESASIPDNVLAGLRELGAYGLQVPEELGGVGLSALQYARLVETVGAHDLGVGIHLGAHQSIGYKGVLLFGSPEMKAKYLPALAGGQMIAGFALTEPSTGSDANSVRTRAVQQPDGSWRLTGSKLWCSNGGIAGLFTVFAQTSVPDAKNPGQMKDKVTAFVVERKFGGVTNGPPEKKMGIKASNTAEVFFDNTPVPAENVLGEVGGGFKVAMEILNNGRFGLGATMAGTMKACIKGAVEHANNRTQFGRKLKDFGLIKHKIASMSARCYGAEALAYALAANMDRGMSDYRLEAAVSKVYASEAAWYVADETIQILGGLGFMREYPYERVLRDLRIFRIFEGTNEILRLMLAGVGLQSTGAALKPLADAMKSPLTNLPTLLPFGVQLAKARIGMQDTPKLGWAPSELSSAASILESNTAAFGVACRELVMRYGKTLIEQQIPVAQAADVAIDLTVLAASLSRAARAIQSKSPTAAHEIELVNLIAIESAMRLRENLRGMSQAGKGVKGSGEHTKATQLKYTIADSIFTAGEYHARHPVGF